MITINYELKIVFIFIQTYKSKLLNNKLNEKKKKKMIYSILNSTKNYLNYLK